MVLRIGKACFYVSLHGILLSRNVLNYQRLALSMTDCLFCKIARKEIPSNVVYEDEDVLAFLDIKPVHPGHTVIIPKKHSDDISELGKDVAGPLMNACQKISAALLSVGADGVTVQSNIKAPAGQVIFHTHIHIIPRYSGDGLRLWPQHSYAEGSDREWQEKLLVALRH